MKKLKVHAILAAMIVGIGLVLMAGKMYADSEPGGIPILLLVAGIGWYITTRVRRRSHLR